MIFLIIYLVCIFIVSYMILPLLNRDDVTVDVQRSIMLLVLFSPIVVIYWFVERFITIPIDTIYNFINQDNNSDFEGDVTDEVTDETNETHKDESNNGQ